MDYTEKLPNKTVERVDHLLAESMTFHFTDGSHFRIEASHHPIYPERSVLKLGYGEVVVESLGVCPNCEQDLLLGVCDRCFYTDIR